LPYVQRKSEIAGSGRITRVRSRREWQWEGAAEAP